MQRVAEVEVIARKLKIKKEEYNRLESRLYEVLAEKLGIVESKIGESEIFKFFYKIGVEGWNLSELMGKNKDSIRNVIDVIVSRMEDESLNKGIGLKSSMKVSRVLVETVERKVKKELEVQEIKLFKRLESFMLRVLVERVGIGEVRGELEVIEVLSKIKVIAENWDLIELLGKPGIFELVSKMGKIVETCDFAKKGVWG